MQILVSGASISGPVLAYWLTRRGFDVTVVERAPTLRKTGGHAVDLFQPAMLISEQMGVLPRIQQRVTGTRELTIHRIGASRPARIDYAKLIAATSDRHVEIMRDDLSEIYFDAGRADVEYLFGDHITAISEDGDVTFAHAAPRRFDVVVGADGLHSGVRQLAFGGDAAHTRFLGGYLSVLSVPKSLACDGESAGYLDVDRLAMIYTANHLDDARAVFLFRPKSPLRHHHRDTAAQRAALRGVFTGMASEVDGWLSRLDGDAVFYFDSITQLEMAGWSRGRVTLVGDAGYCPGPAVGGSTSLSVLGAYVLAGELERAGGDYRTAFLAYEQAMREPVLRSRAFARGAARRLIPTTRLGVRTLILAAQLISALPTGLTRSLVKFNDKGIRLYDSMRVPDYPVATA